MSRLAFHAPSSQSARSPTRPAPYTDGARDEDIDAGADPRDAVAGGLAEPEISVRTRGDAVGFDADGDTGSRIR